MKGPKRFPARPRREKSRNRQIFSGFRLPARGISLPAVLIVTGLKLPVCHSEIQRYIVKKTMKTMGSLFFAGKRDPGSGRIVALWGLFYGLLFLSTKGFFFQPTRYFLSGGYFRMLASGYFDRPFNLIHAGTALDQPTIGKFLFWYTILSIAVIGTSLLIQFAGRCSGRRSRRIHAVIFLLSYLNALCFLLVPATLLIHYIHDRGCTPARIYGIWWIAGWQLLWLAAAVENLWFSRGGNLPIGRIPIFPHRKKA